MQNYHPFPVEDGVTYAKKIEKAEARVDWSALPKSWIADPALSPFQGRGVNIRGNGSNC